jgi:hypothetical protein
MPVESDSEISVVSIFRFWLPSIRLINQTIKNVHFSEPQPTDASAVLDYFAGIMAESDKPPKTIGELVDQIENS